MRYLYVLFFLSSCVFAQTREVHNQGEVHIHPNTLVSVVSPFVNSDTGVFTNDGELIFYSHISNDGQWGFTEGLMGYTRFESRRLQDMLGSRPAKFYDILFNNSTSEEAFAIYGELQAYGEIDFYDGIVNTRTTGGSLTFYEDAYAISANDNSYVDGWVYKVGNSNFEYPIGHESYYRPMQIFGSSGIDDTYAAIYHLENSDTYFSHNSKEENIDQINTEEYWELNDIVTSNHVYVTLSLDSRTTPAEFRNPNNDPTIVAWNTHTERWEDIGGALDVEGQFITTIFKVDLYGAYTLAAKKEVEEEEEFEIFNAVNPNDTGGNEYFRITGLDKYPDNDVTIFNRWGIEVFQTKGYDTNGNVFNGISKGRVTVRKNKELPEGTYFYVIRRTDPKSGERLTNTGYLYLIR